MSVDISDIEKRLDAAQKERPYEDRGLAHEESSKAWSDLYDHAPEDIRALLAEVKAVRELHRKVPLYDTPADECTEHDPDIYGIELDYAGEWYCSQHVAEWVCAECFTDDGEYVEYPCSTMRALGATE